MSGVLLLNRSARRLVMAFALCSCLAAVASGCSSDGRRASPRAAGGEGASAAGPSQAGAAAGDDAAGGSEAAAGGASEQAGQGSGASAGEPAGGAATAGSGAGGDASLGGESSEPGGPFTGPDPFPCDSDAVAVSEDLEAVCAPGGEWGEASAVASAASAGAILLGITPDELTLVWSEAQGSELTHFVADRAAVSEPFGSPQRLEGVSVLAVSPDGLRLAAASPDQSALVVLERADRASEFGSEAEGEFSLIDAHARDSGFSFSSCAFAPDDRTLFYTAGGPDSKYLLHVAERTDDGPWGVGTLLEQCELEVHGGYGRYPTGVSADGQTLFFYDSWRGVMRAAWRDPETSAFTWFEDVGDLFGARPNAACDKLYFSLPGEQSAILSAAAE